MLYQATYLLQEGKELEKKLIAISLSPQSVASLAATYSLTASEVRL